MAPLHVTTQGAVVRKRGMQVVVTKGVGKRRDFKSLANRFFEKSLDNGRSI